MHKVCCECDRRRDSGWPCQRSRDMGVSSISGLIGRVSSEDSLSGMVIFDWTTRREFWLNLLYEVQSVEEVVELVSAIDKE